MAKSDLNDPVNVLEKLTERVKQEFQTVVDAQKTETSRDEMLQLHGKLIALGDVQQWIADARIADLQELPVALDRGIRLRENCLKLADMYQEFSELLATVIPQMSTEQLEGFKILHTWTQQTCAVLRGFATTAKPEEYAEVERVLDSMSVAYKNIKEHTLSNASFRGTLH
jgi:hypothetical protein